MIEFKDYSDALDFTGICKILSDDKICYYIDGILQQKIEASIKSQDIKRDSLIHKGFGYFYIMVGSNFSEIPKHFNGVANISIHMLAFFKDGKLHREDGPAMMNCNGKALNYFYKGYDDTYYNNGEYIHSNKDWKKLVEKIKEEEEFSIFK